MSRLKFVCFSFVENKIESIYFDDAFFERYNKYRELNQLPYGVEDLVSFYFIENGWKVDRLYLQRTQGLDLKITKGGETKHVEVKSETDAVKFNQLEFIFETSNCVIIWVRRDETDLRDIMY